MPHSFGKHEVVEHEDEGLIRPKNWHKGAGGLRSLVSSEGESATLPDLLGAPGVRPLSKRPQEPKRATEGGKESDFGKHNHPISYYITHTWVLHYMPHGQKDLHASFSLALALT